MVERLPALFSKLALVAVVGVVATTGLAYAAEQQISSPIAHRATAAKPRSQVLVVPDVHNQAFVFAKGVLQDSGFAWRVRGSVQGFPPNIVVGQWPAPGTRVLDTGAPLVTVKLARNKSYAQDGLPENSSPYRPTAIRSADSVSSLLTPYAHATLVKPKAPTRTHRTKVTPAPKRIVVVRRPAAFVVPGAPKEPLDEMPLTARATLLGRWLLHNPHPTNAGVKHWLFQNAWIVTGARFGWWHGAAALRILIDVDRRTESAWGIGAKSRLLAEQTLAAVAARSR